MRNASAENYDAPSPSTYVSAERGRREINEIPFARAGAIQRLSPRRVDRIPERMQEASQLPSFSFSRSLLLFVCRRRQLLRRYFNPSGHLSPAHCGIKFPYCHATRPQRSAIVDAQRGGGYCNFYRWTGVCALTQEKNELYEMTRPIAHGHPKAEGLYMCWYI